MCAEGKPSELTPHREAELEKIDFRKSMRELYAPKHGAFSGVTVPPMNFLMIDGKGDPGKAQSYTEAVEALYSVAYTLKFMSKKQLERDYVVPPLEGLWWADDMAAFVKGDRASWRWTMMIMQPDWITGEMVEEARTAAAAKKALPAIPLMRFERFDEGFCLQTMHIGSYADEAPVLKKLHEEVMPTRGMAFNGKHHEIYIGDPRKTVPDKLKTVLRQPVRPA